MSSSTLTVVNISMSGIYTYTVNTFDGALIGHQLISGVNILHLSITATMNIAAGTFWWTVMDTVCSVGVVVGYLKDSSSSLKLNYTTTTITTNNSN